MCQLAEEYSALVFLDECHATGFLGDTGRYYVHTSMMVFLNSFNMASEIVCDMIISWVCLAVSVINRNAEYCVCSTPV